ncbi:MAG: aminotransferase class V-fold PLP-dependent enzyme [Bacteroidota bacterium]|nr:aminotransferase class V-fold PLP-dependent enzyme [Bacteroidota bacterium]
MEKRTFIKSFGAFSLIPFFNQPLDIFCETSSIDSLKKITKRDELWEVVRSQYNLNPDYINLESGFYNIIPNPTLTSFIDHVKRINYEGSFYMRNYLEKDKEQVTKSLADLVGCTKEELIITRNTTESLDLIISGFPWIKGDEAIYADQDYGSMKQMFKQVSKRHGITNKVISIPNHPKSDEEIVSLYENQISEKTRLMMVPHMINITGQILPIKKICEMAHKNSVEVMVDGAHCVGHFDFKISELGCDYYGSSLHKWLAAPLGSGILYVNKKRISKIWPLIASHVEEKNNVKRLNHIGTHPVHTDLAILNAIDYLNWMGLKRKEERLRFLQNYWTSALRNVSNIIINTPIESFRSCGIANVGIKGISPSDLAKKLMTDYKIFTVAIDYANVQGCRITPNVFTSIGELDTLIEALKDMS